MESSLLHVLIVDDSPEDRLTARRLLTQPDPGAYIITEASRGDQALATCAAALPDCILLDYGLPDMDGLAVLTALRDWSDVSVVLLTGIGSEALAVEALRRGAQDYLIKEAVTPDRLHLTIQHAVEAVRLTRERNQALAMLTAMLDALPVGILVLDADLCVRQANPALATFLGQSAPALSGQTLAQLWPDLAAPLAAFCADVLRGGRFSDLELYVPAGAAHAEHWLSFSGTPLRGTNAHSALALVTVQDITARRQAEAALRDSQQRLLALIENTEGAIWSVDTQYRLIVANVRLQQEVRAVLGRDLIPGENLLALELPPAFHDWWRTHYDRALAGEAFSVERPALLERASRTLEYRCSPIRAADGAITGVTVFGQDITTRKRTEVALRDTEQKLGTLFALLPVGIAILDAAGTVVYTNPALSQILQLDQAALLSGGSTSRRYLRVDGTPMPPDAFASVRAARSQQPVSQVETGIITESGDVVWTSVSAAPVDFPDWRVVVVTTDITARKQAEDALQASTAKLATALESMTDAVCISDLEGRFIDFNAAFATFHKFPTKAACARTLAEYPTFLDVYLPTGELAPLERWAVPRALRGETATNAEYTLRRKDSGETWVGSYSFAPIRGPDGAIVGAVVVGRDITEHKRAEHALRENEALLRTFFDHASEIVWVKDTQGRFVRVNRWTEQVLGKPREALLGHTVGELFAASEATMSTANDQQVLATNQPMAFEEATMLPDGAHTFLAIKFPIQDDSGQVYGLGAICTDITTRKAMEEQLRLSEARQNFLLQLNDQLRPLTDPTAIQFTAVSAVGAYLGASRVGYAEDQGDGETIVVTRNYTNGVPDIAGRYRYDDYGPALLRAFRAGQTVVRPDIANDPTLTESEKAAHAMLQLGATVNVPLLKAGRLVAVLFLHSSTARPWSPDEVALLEDVATRTWEAVERARAEAALRESETRFRTVTELSPDGILVHQDGALVYANPAAARIAGLADPARLIGLAPAALLAAEYLDFVQIATAHTLAGAAAPGAEVDVVRPDGARVTVEVSAARILWGGAPAVEVLWHDVTERKQAEATRRAAEAQVRRALTAEQSARLTAEAATARMARLQALTADLAGALAQDAVHAVITNHALAATGASATVLSARDPDDRQLTLIGWAGHGMKEPSAVQHILRHIPLPMVAAVGAGEAIWLRSRADAEARFPGLGIIMAQAGHVAHVTLPLLSADRVQGALSFGYQTAQAFPPEECAFLLALAQQCAQALERARLYADLREREARLRHLSERLIAVQEEERRHLARELHDEIGQTLTGLSLLLTPGSALPPDLLTGRLATAQRQVADLITQVRQRSLDLRPMMLDDLGLQPALDWYLTRYQEQTGITLEVVLQGITQRFAPTVELTVYRIVQEALTNVARHAGVGEATVLIWVASAQLMLEVSDAGRGFDWEAVRRTHTSAGLIGMSERAALLGGMLTIESEPGAGTRLFAALPLRRLPPTPEEGA